MFNKAFWGSRLCIAGIWITITTVHASEEQHFDLLELRVKGNSLLERRMIERTVYPFLGKNKTIETVESARSALEAIYHQQGFQTVAVDIPEQDVEGGIVYLEVAEGKVSKLRVSDSRYFSLGKIKEKVPELAEGKIPNVPIMQQQLAELAKESPDRQVTPILRAGETPGTLEVDLKVKDELPVHGKVEVNARNVAGTSLLRTIGTISYDNLWQRFHSASLTYQVTPERPDEVEVLVGSYVMPVPAFFESNAKFAFYAVSSSSNSSIASAGALSVIGNGDVYGARLIKPLPVRGNYSHSFTTGLDYKSFSEDLNLIGADTLKTPITYLPFTAQYNGNLLNDNSTLSFNVGVDFSVRGLGNDTQEFANKRFGAKADYIVLNAGLDYKYKLPGEMDLRWRLSGQVANSPIISNEQYSIGGSESVRGYFETQMLSDDGVQTSLEWYSPRLIPSEGNWESINSFRGLVFLDAGRGWLQNALSGVDDQVNLASSGVGLRFQGWKYLTANLDIAVPFIDNGRINAGDPRVHFRVLTEF